MSRECRTQQEFTPVKAHLHPFTMQMRVTLRDLQITAKTATGEGYTCIITEQ